MISKRLSTPARLGRRLRAFAAASLLAAMAWAAGPAHADDVAYYGILLPLGPNNYSVLMSHLKNDKVYKLTGYTFHTGTIHGVPVVTCVQRIDGDATRGLVAQKMMDTFHLKALIYAGTSGSHLKRLHIGDVLIARRVVDFGNFITNRSGEMVPGEFHNGEPNAAGAGKMMYLYNSVPLSDLAYRAAVALKLETPAWMNQNGKSSKTYIMNYGTQGSSAMWIRSPEIIGKFHKIFHEADESGGYDTALAALLNKVPFVELNTISDSALEVPTKFDAYLRRSSFYTQKVAYEIVLKMLEMIHAGDVPKGLTGYQDMTRNPYPADVQWNH